MNAPVTGNWSGWITFKKSLPAENEYDATCERGQDHKTASYRKFDARRNA